MAAVWYISLFCLYFLHIGSCQSGEANIFSFNSTNSYFNGSSHLTFKGSFNFYFTPIGFSFKTCQKYGSLLHQVTTENHTVLKVGLMNGFLQVNYTFPSQNQTVSYNGRRRCDRSTWVNLLFHKSLVTAFANGRSESIADISKEVILRMYDTLQRNSTFTVGSNEDGTNGFVGCIAEGPNWTFNRSVEVVGAQWNACGFNDKLCDRDACDEIPCLNNGVCIPFNGTYACRCPPNFSGLNCQISTVAACNATACVNGTCVSIADRSLCRCDSNFYGRNCSLPGSNPCDDSLCSYNASCFSDDYGGYFCHCRPGYLGERCEIETSNCLSNPCLNNGLCVDFLRHYECDCNGTGYHGELCELDDDECVEDPCWSPEATCLNRPGDYVCLCPSGYEGEACNVTIDYCALEPCLNDGHCEAIPGAGFKCVCALGFVGDRCEEEIDNCIGNKCDPRSQLCISEPGRHYCICKEGFGGSGCEELNECESDPCTNHAECVDLINSFQCLCQPGYRGIRCQEDIDECEDDPCENGATCEDLVADYWCDCKLGWSGKNCSQEFDPCRSNPCENNATCSPLPHTLLPPFVCRCPDGFTGIRCEVNIDDCASVTCAFNEACRDHVRSYSCDCRPGYVRDVDGNCTIEVDECESNPCRNGANCTDLLDEFECVCAFGYEGVMCEREKDFCESNPCFNGGICDAIFGSYTCFCKPGFVGTRCEVSFDSCYSDPCANGNCTSTGGQYSCECEPGYEGANCQLDVDECASSPCLHNGTCNDLIGRFSCTCRDGWEGRVCEENVDECQSEPCLNGATCQDLVSGYSCSCPLGFDGVLCETNVNECASNPCSNGGWCIDDVASYRCDCNDTGYEGRRCEVEVNECLIGEPCLHGARCIDRVNDYTCQCLAGFTGRNCEIDINECLSDPCLNRGTCLELSDQSWYPERRRSNFSYENASGFLCRCSDGFIGDLCETEVDECRRDKPCLHSSICTDLINDYHCQCMGEYGGKNCSVPLIGCSNGHDCLNDAICIPFLVDENADLHNYTCDCAPGFAGSRCQYVTSGSFRGRSSRAVFRVNSTVTTFAFAFRTTVARGFLASLRFGNETVEMYLLYLLDGILRYSRNGSTIATSPSDWSLNTGEWQTVRVHLRGSNSSGGDETIFSNFTIGNLTDTILTDVSVGRDPPSSASPFIGCLRDVTIDDRVYRFHEADLVEHVEEGCLRSEVCNSTTCGGRGTCIDMWHEPRCECDRPYFGSDCGRERLEGTFGFERSRSHALFKMPHDVVSRFNASMFMLTRQSNGLLLQTAPGGSSEANAFTVRLALSGGSLLVTLNERSYYFGSVVLNDGQYHFIDVRVNQSDLAVRIDDSRFTEAIDLDPSLIATSFIYIGGMPSEQPGRRKRATDEFPSFKGVFKDIRSGGFILMLFPDEEGNNTLQRTLVYPVSTVHVERGEVSDPVCGDDTNSTRSNPCLNNGTCLPAFNAYTCECTEAWRGGNCEIPIYCRHVSCSGDFTCVDSTNVGYECDGLATVNSANRAIEFAHSAASRSILIAQISLRLRTRSVNTSIIKVESNSGRVRIALDQFGRVQFEAGNSSSILHRGSTVADGEWHVIVVRQQNSSISLTVDDETEDVLSPASPFEDILRSADFVLLGDRGSASFKGCIGSARVGGYLLPFYNRSTPADLPLPPTLPFILLSGALVSGCHGDDVCGESRNSCRNNGTCRDTFNRFVCDCRAGFSGDTCDENVDDCVDVECSGRGNCSDRVNGFVCRCETGYKGKLCEVQIDECASSPCLNNGTCRDLIGSYECDCHETNFLGTRCEINATFACGPGNFPCQNDGNCTNATLDDQIVHRCACPSFFYGEECQHQIDLCANVTCMNGGSCDANPATNTTKCRCPIGFDGPMCNHSFDRCSNLTCANNGTCVDTPDGYRCVCADGYLGSKCEHRNLCVSTEESELYCANNATCNVEGTSEISFSCKCNSSFIGERCNFLDPCLDVTCLNGGTCQITWSFQDESVVDHVINTSLPVFQCECTVGFSGEKCDVADVIALAYSRWFVVGSTTGAAVVVVLIALFAGLACYAKTSHAKRGHYSPRSTETTEISKMTPLPPIASPERLI